MNARRPVLATATLALGGAVAAGLFWALLNVPESNLLALTLSAALLLAIVATLGGIIAASSAVADGAGVAGVLRRSIAAMPAFALGVIVFAALWWLTGAIDAWWRAHRGEVDAASIRYLNVARTQSLHQAVFLILWIVRWVIGLSIVAALATTAAAHGVHAAGAGLRNAVRPAPIAAGLAAALLLTGLWRLVYWRPARLAPWLEPTFVASKLTVLYVAAVSIVALALAVHRRAARASGDS
jgi:hypothetical protein